MAIGCAAALFLSACQNMPEPYAPPVQRQPLPDFRPYRISAIVNMSDEDAGGHFIRDISPLGTVSWRWTGKRPTVRVRIRTAERLRYTIDFALPETTLQATGPVTVSFFVNDRVLGRARYRRAGSQHFEKAVPAGWVVADQDVALGAEVDKVWVSPEDGTKLGLVLVRIGLTQ
jgi:hypothetical protein